MSYWATIGTDTWSVPETVDGEPSLITAVRIARSTAARPSPAPKGPAASAANRSTLTAAHAANRARIP